MSVNSSSSIERFTLGAGESKTWVNTDLGGNLWTVDVNGELVQNMDGTIAASVSATCTLQTSETLAGPFVDVATVTVASNGYDAFKGATGKFARIINVAGPGIVHVVAKPARRVNPAVAL